MERTSALLFFTKKLSSAPTVQNGPPEIKRWLGANRIMEYLLRIQRYTVCNGLCTKRTLNKYHDLALPDARQRHAVRVSRNCSCDVHGCTSVAGDRKSQERPTSTDARVSRVTGGHRSDRRPRMD